MKHDRKRILLDRRSVSISNCKIFTFQNKTPKNNRNVFLLKKKKLKEIFIPACENQFYLKGKAFFFGALFLHMLKETGTMSK